MICSHSSTTTASLAHDLFDIAIGLLIIALRYRALGLYVVFFERIGWHVVETDRWLIRILDQNVFAIVFLHDHVNEGTNNCPAIVQVQVHLRCELAWLVTQNTKDNMLGRRLGVGTRNEPGSGC